MALRKVCSGLGVAACCRFTSEAPIRGVLSTPVKHELAANIIAASTVVTAFLELACTLSALLGGIDSQVVVDERIDVGVFLHNLGFRLSGAMSCIGVDSYQLGTVAGVGSLQGCRIFEGVCGAPHGRRGRR